MPVFKFCISCNDKRMSKQADDSVCGKCGQPFDQVTEQLSVSQEGQVDVALPPM